MAVSSASTAASLSSCNLRRPLALRPSALAASRSLWRPSLGQRPAGRGGLSAFAQRPIVPLVISLPHLNCFSLQIEAKKQTYSSFDDLLEKSDRPVLVDFYATWCGPCQFMVPVLEEVSERMNDKIQVVKIDTEIYASIANRYQIQALPTFIIFRDGKPCDRFEGAMNADQLIQRVESALKVTQ